MTRAIPGTSHRKAVGCVDNPGIYWVDNIDCRMHRCIPPKRTDNPPGQIGVDRAQQSGTLGHCRAVGRLCQQNTFRRYTGHGETRTPLRIHTERSLDHESKEVLPVNYAYRDIRKHQLLLLARSACLISTSC